MDTNINEYSYQNSKAKDIVITSLLIALVFIATKFINIRLPISVNGGLIHLGNTALFIAAIVFGKKKGAIAGAFGMCLFDILSGWIMWAPFTFIIRGVMGYLVGYIAYTNGKNGRNLYFNLMGIVLGGIWMIIGYYMTEVILYGNWIYPITSIPGNITQIIIGAILGLPVASILKKANIS
ncbi:ECF transporter S component [Tepidibacter aestuarii]|uniref:ECF transporter S component n=1 Tax=Tepidibacter aestuarii TaxID=2925782 RepID=UPI0020BF3670|nr:ECF transporter S component [Tepidibacter aestuarii]CAH2214059.1 Substrate-specific component PdxU2 of predicted pyridoxin-related ECF transporter [Tepidibacter aestuarii]